MTVEPLCGGGGGGVSSTPLQLTTGLVVNSCSDNTSFGIKSIRSPAKVGLVVTDLITSPVVSWRGWETPPSTASQLSFFAQPRLSEDLSLRVGLPSSSATICLRLVDGLDFLFDI